MTEQKQSLGGAIDQIIDALEPLSEAARETALSAVCSYLDIAVGGTAPPGAKMQAPIEDRPSSVGKDADAVPAPKPRASADIRSLKNAKNPENAVQMACVVAYYLQELAPEDERKDYVTKSDLEKYFKQAAFPLPEGLQYVLPNGKKGGYFESASARGGYKLNAVGYNLVAHGMQSSGGDD